MPKKQVRNAFYFFMKDIEPQLRREGRVLNGMQDIVPIAHPRWKILSDFEKERYEKVAKEYKAKMRGVEGDQYRIDCVGNIIAHRRDENKEIEKKNQKERQSVRSKWPTGKALADETFYFIDFQTLCKTEEGDYLPAEIGAVEFSIRKGVTKKLHRFIQPGAIPLGYRSICKMTCEDKNQIPIENFKEADKNYRGLWIQLENFCNPNGEKPDYPPYYCLNRDIEETAYCLEWVHQRACLGIPNRLRKVYDLGFLLVDIFTHMGKDVSYTNANDVLTSSSWDYEPKTRCDFHEEKECKFCSLGIVNRYAYAMADSLCKTFSVPLTAKHLPVRPEGESALIVLPPSAMSRGDTKGGWGQAPRNRSKGWAPVEMPKQEPVIINAREESDDEFESDESDDDTDCTPALRRPNIPADAALGGYSQAASGYSPQAASGFPSQTAGSYASQAASSYASQAASGYSAADGYSSQESSGYSSQPAPWARSASLKAPAPSLSDQNFPSLGRGTTIAPLEKFAERVMAPHPNSAPVPPAAWKNDIRPAIKVPPGFAQQRAPVAPQPSRPIMPVQRPLGMRPMMNPLQQQQQFPLLPDAQSRMPTPSMAQAPTMRGPSPIHSGFVRGRGRGILGNIQPGHGMPVGRGYKPSTEPVQVGLQNMALDNWA